MNATLRHSSELVSVLRSELFVLANLNEKEYSSEDDLPTVDLILMVSLLYEKLENIMNHASYLVISTNVKEKEKVEGLEKVINELSLEHTFA